MTAVEFMQHCMLFDQFGKIKDIDFDSQLLNEEFHDGKVFRMVDFDTHRVVIGEYVDFGCECCGGYYENQVMDLDDLAKHGYLSELIDMMDNALKIKTGI
jgi:hypothetical protein